MNIDQVLEYVEEQDVKFIRLSFCDVFGKQKNVSILPDELPKAFKEGISIDGSAIDGFMDEKNSDLFLYPDPDTCSILPWRSMEGAVIRMECQIKYPDETPFERDCRYILKKAIRKAKEKGITFVFGTEFEFYLFKLDENENNTYIPLDQGGYMDVSPEDKGEDVRREICFTLSDMGIQPEASHHEEGPGQNEIDFRYSTALRAADNAQTFKWVVKTISKSNGLYADFSPKPLKQEAGNGLHINISIESEDNKDYLDNVLAGLMNHLEEMTLFLNPDVSSYERIGKRKAPKYITWSAYNRTQAIRIPATKSKNIRLELRSPDPCCNPYLAFALIIYAGLDGIERNLKAPEEVNVNLYQAKDDITSQLKAIPDSIRKASNITRESEFIAEYIPEKIIEAYLK
ncbi:MAG: glutamine synthetase family protein [Floccifex porci]|uniref:glutamine synthetase family protein n=1 Tax=Floccifex porci TaxID=2606629 RepID=UPI0023F017E7|nr:glutamine synthetase family protein [Floccifex porci]MCI7802409.1 glutamine synthetase family protein [Erysipelotrichaceae bacterium]MDD7467540.1 glutamine synthetase family protein [Floccifex porci]